MSGGALGTGLPTQILNTGSVALNAGGTLALDILGSTAGTNYDQLNVTGTVSLGGAALALNIPSPPAIGSTFTLISNDGSDAVVGTFAGLPEGATVRVNSLFYQISYVGGTGNDVVLTRVATPVAPATTRYVDPSYASLTNGSAVTDADPVAASNQGALVGTTAFGSLSAAVAASSPGDTIVVDAGAYTDNIVIDRAVTLVFQSGSSSLASLSDTVSTAGIILDGVALSVANGSTSTINSSILGTGGITMAGTGTLTLAGNNGYTGGTTVASGILEAGSSTSFGVSSSVTVTGILRLGGNSVSIANLSGAGTVDNTSSTSAVLTVFDTAAVDVRRHPDRRRRQRQPDSRQDRRRHSRPERRQIRTPAAPASWPASSRSATAPSPVPSPATSW